MKQTSRNSLHRWYIREMYEGFLPGRIGFIKGNLKALKIQVRSANNFHADKEDNRREKADKELGKKVKFYFRGLTLFLF